MSRKQAGAKRAPRSILPNPLLLDMGEPGPKATVTITTPQGPFMVIWLKECDFVQFVADCKAVKDDPGVIFADALTLAMDILTARACLLAP